MSPARCNRGPTHGMGPRRRRCIAISAMSVSRYPGIGLARSSRSWCRALRPPDRVRRGGHLLVRGRVDNRTTKDLAMSTAPTCRSICESRSECGRQRLAMELRDGGAAGRTALSDDISQLLLDGLLDISGGSLGLGGCRGDCVGRQASTCATPSGSCRACS